MKKVKVYTRTGDKGTSQLLSVGRVPKDHPRLAVYGDTDELNSVIGIALSCGLSRPLDKQLAKIQDEIFILGSQIAVPNPDRIKYPIPKITARHTSKLERWIDKLDAEIAPLKNFILPGGVPGASHLHHARTVCRRCERRMQTLHQAEGLPNTVLIYINRLSDYLFTAARYENMKNRVEDIPWKS